MTSREKIVEAALDIAATDPTTPVSMVSIARKLRIANMAIYNYFPNKDALIQELSARLLDKLLIEIPEGAKATEMIKLWAFAMRVHFLKHPELMQILGWEDGYTSAAWLNKSKELFRALKMLGFEGDELAKTIRFIWNVVMSAISIELHDRTMPPTISESAYGRLEAEVKPVVAIMRQSAESDGFNNRFFDYSIAMMMRVFEA